MYGELFSMVFKGIQNFGKVSSGFCFFSCLKLGAKLALMLQHLLPERYELFTRTDIG